MKLEEVRREMLMSRYPEDGSFYILLHPHPSGVSMS
jgi:hypothetical protein